MTEWVSSDLLRTDRIRHAFMTRRGGCSEGIYASLNCGLGSDDDRGAVLENRARAAGAVGTKPGNLLSPYQYHSAEVIEVTGPWAPGEGPRADGLVTTRPDFALGISTADCAPVLFADGGAGVIGAAHAGWRGASGGVLEATLAAMEKLGARREAIRAAIGPTISQQAYEVGPEFEEKFVAADAGNARFFRPGPNGRAHFDLPGYIADRLSKAGLAAVEDLGICTYGDEDRFFSYRRMTHRKEADYGRQLSLISLQG